MSPQPGAVIAWWDGQKLMFGAVDSEDKQRLRVIDGSAREQRVKLSKLAAVAGRPTAVTGREPERRQALADCARAVEAQVSQEAAEVDAALLWELSTEEASNPPEPQTAESLADLALGRTDGSAVAATLVALVEDGARFSRKGANWIPRSTEAVQGILRQREVVQRREQETVRFLKALSGLSPGSPWASSGDETERGFVQALRELAVKREEVGEGGKRRAHQALEAWGEPFVRDYEGAFRLLRILGEFDSDDQNLQLERFGLPGDFDTELLAEAQRRSEVPFAEEGRRDLTDLLTVTVDGAATRELDDALSWEPSPDGGGMLGIHIADPSAFVSPGDPIDRVALERATTHYFPDGKISMLPPQISEGCASLVCGERRPALSYLVSLSDDGALRKHEIVRSVIRCDRRLTYEEFDNCLATPTGDRIDSTVSGLAAFGQARLVLRRAAGAVHLAGPEAEIALTPEGPLLQMRQRHAPSQIAVSEAMVLVGELSAELLSTAETSAIYRGQSEPASAPTSGPADKVDEADKADEADEGEGAEGDAARDRRLLLELHRTRRRLRRAESALRPRPHHSLALPAYVQATSPLRRYQDWVNQRQLISVVEGRDPVHDREDLQQILATTDVAERRARRAEREANEYWLLRWLEQRTGSTMPALVLETEPKPWVLLLPCLWERSLPRLPDCMPGDTLEITIVRVCPRAGLVQLQPV